MKFLDTVEAAYHCHAHNLNITKLVPADLVCNLFVNEILKSRETIKGKLRRI